MARWAKKKKKGGAQIEQRIDINCANTLECRTCARLSDITLQSLLFFLIVQCKHAALN